MAAVDQRARSDQGRAADVVGDEGQEQHEGHLPPGNEADVERGIACVAIQWEDYS